MTKAPCYDEATKTDCPDRCSGCHASCKAYLDYESQHRLELKESFAERYQSGQVADIGRIRYDRAVNKATHGRKRVGYK